MLGEALAGAMGAASPRIARSGPARRGVGAGHHQNKNTHATPCGAATLGARRMHGQCKPGGVASRHRCARGPTSRDGTPPDNQRSWYPPAILRACEVPHDGNKRRRIPARYRARAPVGDVGGCSGARIVEDEGRKTGAFQRGFSLNSLVFYFDA